MTDSLQTPEQAQPQLVTKTFAEILQEVSQRLLADYQENVIPQAESRTGDLLRQEEVAAQLASEVWTELLKNAESAITNPEEVSRALRNVLENDSEILQKIKSDESLLADFAIVCKLAQEYFKQLAKNDAPVKKKTETLSISVDQTKTEEQIAEVTNTDFFQSVQAQARLIREKNATKANKPKPTPFATEHTLSAFEIGQEIGTALNSFEEYMISVLEDYLAGDQTENADGTSDMPTQFEDYSKVVKAAQKQAETITASLKEKQPFTIKMATKDSYTEAQMETARGFLERDDVKRLIEARKKAAANKPSTPLEPKS